MKIKVTLILLVICFVFSCFVPSFAQTEMPSTVAIAAGAKGSVWFSMCIDWVQKIMQIEGVWNTAIIEGGAVGNLKIVNEGKDSFIGFTHAPLYFEAVRGDLFDEPIENVLAITALGFSIQQYIVREDSGINGFEDLIDKNLLPGTKGGGAELLLNRILNVYGFDYDKVRGSGGNVSFTSYGDMASLMGDRHADLALISGDAPHASALEMEAFFNIRLLEVPQNIIDQLISKFPGYLTVTIPANTYSGQPNDVQTLAIPGIMVANANTHEDIIYEIVKTLWENSEELAKRHPYYVLLNKENFLQGLTEDTLHPGALKYYKEVGWID